MKKYRHSLPHNRESSNQRQHRYWSVWCMLVTLSLISNVEADDDFWDGGTGTQVWNDPGNWLDGFVPGAVGTTNSFDTAHFNINDGATAITIDEGRNLESFIFYNTAGAFTIGSEGANLGHALHLTSAGTITMRSGIANTITFNAPIIIEPGTANSNGSYSFVNNASITAGANAPKLNFAGNISGGATTGTFTLNLNGTVGTRNANNSAGAVAQANTISGVISNGSSYAAGMNTNGILSLAISGTTTDANNINAWNLTGANTFSGSVNLAGNSVLYYNTLADTGFASALGTGSNGAISVSGYLIYTGDATSSNRTFTGAGGNIYNNGTGTLTLTGNVNINNGSGIIFRGNNTIEVSGLISGGTTSSLSNVSKTNGNTLILSNTANTFTGNITIAAGTVRASSIADAGTASSLGAGNFIYFGQNQVGDNVGTLQFVGAPDSSTNRLMLINAGAANTSASRATAVIDHAVAGQQLTLNGDMRLSASVSGASAYFSALTLTGVGNGVMNGTVGGINGTGLHGTSVNLLLTKNGAGVWELRGDNRYHGGTNVTAGTLLVNNTIGSGTGTGSVTTSSSGTLGGTGFITSGAGNAITIASGTRLMVGNTHGLASGATDANDYTGAASRLSIGTAANVAITLAGTLQFDLFGNEAGTTASEADRLVVSTTASTMALGGTIALSDVSDGISWRSNGGTGWTSGTWQLIDWSGASSATKTGNFTYNLSVASLGIGYSWDTSSFLTDGTLSIIQTADANIHIWTGADSSSWNTASNWTANSIPTGSRDVIFKGDTTNTATTLNGDTTVRNILFTGEADYSIASGGSGVLYLAGDSVSGATIQVLGGTQNFNVNTRIGTTSSNIYIINEGTLNFTDALVANDWGSSPTNKVLTFSGTGNTTVNRLERRHNTYDMSIIKNGTGTVTINGPNNTDALPNGGGAITGSTTINAGKIRINNERSLGGNPADYNAGHLTLNGGTLGAFGSFAIDDVNRGITLGVNGGTFDVESTFSLAIANVITGPGSLTKTNTGTLRLANANTYLGDTFVQGGTLNVANLSGSATSTGSVYVTGAGSLLSGSGFITASAGGAISIGSGSTLRVGDTHNNSAGTASVLTLGSNDDVALTLNGDMQFDLFQNQDGTPLSESDRLVLLSTASEIDLDGVVYVASPVHNVGTLASGTWQLIDWTGIDLDNITVTGGFTFDLSATQTKLATGFTWDTSNFMTDGTIRIVSTNGAFIWTGEGGDNSWKNGDNWLAGTAPTLSDDVVFQGYGTYPVGGNTIVTDIAPSSASTNNSVRNIFFTGEKNYTVSAGSGVLFTHGSLIEVKGGTQTITAQIRPSTAGNYTIYNDGTLTFTSHIMTNAAVNLIFDGSGNTNLVTISRRGGYNNNIIKNGSGTVTFSGYNDIDGDVPPGYTASGAFIKGTTTINEGTIRINDERNLGGNPNAFNAAQINLNGGKLSAYANVTIDDTNRGITLGANGGTLAAEGSNRFTIANEITGAGTLTKTDTGSLILTASNTYTGNTTVAQGSLFANNTVGSATGTGSVRTVAGSGATLGGSGSILAGEGQSIIVENGTYLIVGETHGVAGSAQDLHLGDGSDVAITLGGTLMFDLYETGSYDSFGSTSYNTLGSANDLLEIFTTGSLNLDNALISLAALDTSGWLEGQTWKLIDWSNIEASSVSYNNLNLATANIDGFQLTQTITADGYYVTVGMVPEPTRAMLLLLATGAVLLRRHRRKDA